MYYFLVIFIASLITFILRGLPFLFSSYLTNLTPYWEFIINHLPKVMMMILVIYCLKDTNLTNGFAVVLSVLSVIIIHLWKKNMLLSIVIPTIIYMILI